MGTDTLSPPTLDYAKPSRKWRRLIVLAVFIVALQLAVVIAFGLYAGSQIPGQP